MALTMPELTIHRDGSSSPTTVCPGPEGRGLAKETINNQLISLQTDVEDNPDVNKAKEFYPPAPEPHRASSFGYLSPTFPEENKTSVHCYSSDGTSGKQTQSSYLSSSADSSGYFDFSSQSPLNARLDPLPTVPDINPYNYPDEDSIKTDDKCSRSRIWIVVIATSIALVVTVSLSASLPIVLKDSTTEALVGGLTLDLEGLTLAQVDEDARFRCSVKNVGALASVVFLFNQTEVARFDVRSDASTSSTHRFSLENRKTPMGTSSC
ncbi:uncharacterized protein LOC112555282 [Pomacea canaliculata]|uniref:uncharacterized protein LOC112555282 n=1 Tax=Pomacea canaliculata TaxID=400727 RepID=UPI000D7375B1|nr:uncharacterized protein LOC112555282 [Pomacea canaliculata]